MWETHLKGFRRAMGVVADVLPIDASAKFNSRLFWTKNSSGGDSPGNFPIQNYSIQLLP